MPKLFRVAVYAIASGEVGNESVDDIIQLAECLIRSKSIFTAVVKPLLGKNMISDLFCVTEQYDDYYYSPSFEDAVMGAVAIFLGTLTDPASDLGGNSNE